MYDRVTTEMRHTVASPPGTGHDERLPVLSNSSCPTTDNKSEPETSWQQMSKAEN